MKSASGLSPVAAVKERFGDKEKLTSAIQALATKELWLDRVSEDKGLERASNAKLLRLHSVLSTAKERFGTRSKLVDAILQLENRAKDTGFKARLEDYPLPRLLDVLKGAEKRSKARKDAPAAPKAKKLARSRKAQAKSGK
jgi:hypothetical protein